MRWFVVAAVACGGAPSSYTTSRQAVVAKHTVHEREPVDPIAVITREPAAVSWLVPSSAQLELGGTSVHASDGAPPLKVVVIEDVGSSLRVAVRLERVRFAAWTERASLLAIVAHDQRVAPRAGGNFIEVDHAEPTETMLRAGAVVRRLGHKDGWTEVRYFGDVEIEGWLPDAAIADSGPPHDAPPAANAHPTMSALPGTVIRSQPKWASTQLAVMANGRFVEAIHDVDDAWVEVRYRDGDVAVHGYVSRRDPPGHLHRPHASEAPMPVIANHTLAAGTCLYARELGEALGYAVIDLPAALEPGQHTGWFAASVETPWGPIEFAVNGPDDHDLVACDPGEHKP